METNIVHRNCCMIGGMTFWECVNEQIHITFCNPSYSLYFSVLILYSIFLFPRTSQRLFDH